MKRAVVDPCECGHARREHAGLCLHMEYANGRRCPCSQFRLDKSSLRGAESTTSGDDKE